MYKIYCITLVFLISMAKEVRSQIIESGDFQSRMTSAINALPDEGANDFSMPDEGEFSVWGTGLSQLLSGEYSSSAATFTSIEYNLIEFTDDGTDRVYYILENNNSNYWGTYVFYPNYANPLVVQSPHPKEDFNTGKQGAYIFENTDAMFFFLAGTNRCNSNDTVECSGQTEACGPKGAFKISDMAHNDTTVFQSTTDTLFRRFSQSWFLQLHGFAKTETDPYVILSNGSKEQPDNDFITALKEGLSDADPTLTFEVAHENEDWDRLIGRTNTQGRLINGSSNACEEYAAENSGRFIHMEQEKTKLRSTQDGWETVTTAVNEAFSTLLPVELKNFSVKRNSDNVTASWKTLTEENNDYFELQRSENGSHWIVAGSVKGAGNSDREMSYLIKDRQPPKGDGYYRLKQVDYDGSVSYSPVRHLPPAGSNLADKLLLYPNPADHVIHLEGPQPNDFNLRVIAASGRDCTSEVSIDKISDKHSLIMIDALSPGIYLIVVNDIRMRRFVKK